MSYKFPVVYWGNHSTKVQFKPFTKLPSDAAVATCMVFAVQNGAVLLAKPPRGWGLPGGHRESGETPEACAVREVFEETAVVVDNLKLVGGWKTQKLIETEANSQYPDIGYQLLYVADISKVNQFNPEYESSERAFVKFGLVGQYHHEYERISEIFKYVLDLLDSSALSSNS